MAILDDAHSLDEALRTRDRFHRLTRRFVIRSAGGTDQYPFPHDKVSLVPKRGIPVLSITGVVLRFALTSEVSVHEPPRPNRVTAVTYGLEDGSHADHVLSDISWEPFAAPGELEIVQGELQGVKNPRKNQDFDYHYFEALLADFEPQLQDDGAQGSLR